MKSFIEQLAREAGEIAMAYLGNSVVDFKGPRDIVTEADKEVEKMIASAIRKDYPGHDIISEEFDFEHKGSNHVWYIDPIDGTSNFALGNTGFAISIGLAKNDELTHACIYIPYQDDLFYAEKGKGAFLNGKRIHVSGRRKLKDSLLQLGISPLKDKIDDSLKIYRHFMLASHRARDSGFSAGQLADVSCGRADAYIKFSQKPWDVAAGILIVEEAGGRVTDAAGEPVAFGEKDSYDVIASNGHIHNAIIDELKKLEYDKENWF